ncbi:MAG: murein hydrolase activator EnvC, partial [Pseudobdellovibrionaceae bacterium]
DGFGTTVILDHGDHYYSIYSGLSKVKVEIGDEIETRQVIAEAGWVPETGMPGLYFEVRHFSEATDPSSWFAKNKNIRVSSTQ